MKVLLLKYHLILPVALLVSCGVEEQQSSTVEFETQDSALIASDKEKEYYFHCPKSCKGIIFKAPGKCPVCEEDLIKIELDTVRIEVHK